jgi:hypothetical protein
VLDVKETRTEEFFDDCLTDSSLCSRHKGVQSLEG